jgi:hypothetical protein
MWSADLSHPMGEGVGFGFAVGKRELVHTMGADKPLFMRPPVTIYTMDSGFM